MMYWNVYALFVASESLLNPILNFWLPFYAEAKVIFLLYLVSSSTRGSSVIYKGWIHLALSSNEAEIDVANEKLKRFQTAKTWTKFRSPDMFLSTAHTLFFLTLRIKMKKHELHSKMRLNELQYDFFQIDNFQFSQYEAEKIMEQDEEMDERMMTMLRYKMQYKESLIETK